MWDMSGKWYHTLPITGVDINYSIKSVAPTNTTDNIVVLDRIAYIAPDTTETTVIIDTTPIEFLPAYAVGLTAPSSVYIGDTNVFQ